MPREPPPSDLQSRLTRRSASGSQTEPPDPAGDPTGDPRAAPTHRRLAAVLIADVVGYSRLMGAYEERTLDRLKIIQAEVIDPTVASSHGRLVKTTGDGLLIEFASVIDALRCASEVQRLMASYNVGFPALE